MMEPNGLEIIEADLLFFPLTVKQLKPVASISPHPEEAYIQRDNNFKIKIEMKGKASNHRDLDVDHDVRLGVVTEAESTQGKCKYGHYDVFLRGVICGNWSSNPHSGEFTHYGSVSVVTEEYDATIEPSSKIVYVLGFPHDMAPRITKRDSAGETTLHRQDTPELGSIQTIKKPAIASSLSSSNDCILLDGKYGTTIFSRGSETEQTKHLKPSYLHIAKGDVLKDGKLQRSYIEALNYVFGKRFVEIGFTDLNSDNEPIRRSSRSPYSLNLNSEVSSHERPPVVIAEGCGYINERLVSNIMELFIDSYDKLNLSDVIWNVWFARMMPLGVQLVAYAAALEALINAWFDNNKSAAQSYYMNNNDYKKQIMPHIDALKNEVPNTAVWEKVFDRINSANQLSISDKYRRFFEEHGLKICRVDNEVMRARHKFAHGGSIEDNDIKQLIVIARAYEALLNRCILKVIGYKGKYRDYSTIDFPERSLDEPLGGPNGDGQI